MKNFKKLSLFADYLHFLSSNDLILVVNYTDLSKNKNNSRQQLQHELNTSFGIDSKKVKLKILKNSLHRIALSKLSCFHLGAMIHGPIFLVSISEYPTNGFLTKLLRWLQSKREFCIVGGKLQDQLISYKDILQLEKYDSDSCSSKNIVMHSLVETITMSTQQISSLMQNPLRNIICQVEFISKAISKK